MPMKTICVSLLLVVALATSACATKKYARTQAGIVNDRLTQVQTQTNEQITALAAKEQTDVSRLDERITTVNNQLSTTTKAVEEVRGSAAQANTAANQAMQQAQANTAQINSANSSIQKMQADVDAQAKAMNYTLSDTSNVMFAFNKSDLSDEAKTSLEAIVKKATQTPRSVVELVGYSDEIGAKPYNNDLSQKRAEEVARYLVQQNFPLKDISVIGMGEQQTPEQLAAEVQGYDPNAPAQQRRSMERRVRIRLWLPAGAATTAAAGTAAGTDSAGTAGSN